MDNFLGILAWAVGGEVTRADCIIFWSFTVVMLIAVIATWEKE